MITGKNESQTLAKGMSCECECKFDRTRCNSNQWWNNTKCWWECKNIHVCMIIKMENGKYFASIMGKIICDEIIDIREANFNEKNTTCKTQSFYILLAFLLITITLLIAVSIYYYLIKYWVKQKHLLPFHNTKLKQSCIDSINWKWMLKI